MFWENFITLCTNAQTTPSAVCKELDLATATATRWRRGSTPQPTNLRKIADYFGVTPESLAESSETPYKPEVSQEAMEIWEAYKNASQAIQEAVRKLLDL